MVTFHFAEPLLLGRERVQNAKDQRPARGGARRIDARIVLVQDDEWRVPASRNTMDSLAEPSDPGSGFAADGDTRVLVREPLELPNRGSHDGAVDDERFVRAIPG